MAVYTCPTCGEKMERDLVLFSSHTDQHIVEAIKKKNPAWITPDGYCPKCLDYYKRSLVGGADHLSRQAASIRFVNLGSREGKKRFFMGMSLLALTLVLFTWLKWSHVGKQSVGMLLPMIFGSILCFLEAQSNRCVILSYKKTRNMDCGEEKISDPEVAFFLKRESIKMILISLAAAMLVMGAAYFLL